MKQIQILKAVLSAFIFVALSGYASAQTPAETKALIDKMNAPAKAKEAIRMKADITGYQLPKLPEAGMAVIYVVRPSIVGFITRFNVFVNNQEPQSELGSTSGDDYVYFSLSPGEYRILSKAENWAEITITAKAGDIIFIKQQADMGFVMARNNLSLMESYEGTYHVKHLSLGKIIKTDFQQTSSQSISTIATPQPLTSTQTNTVTNNQTDTTNTKSNIQPTNISVAQKLRDLQSLRKDEIITEEEYQNKKNELLEKF